MIGSWPLWVDEQWPGLWCNRVKCRSTPTGIVMPHEQRFTLDGLHEALQRHIAEHHAPEETQTA